MKNSAASQHQDPAHALLKIGLKDLWFPVCPSGFVGQQPVSLRRLGYKIVLWRDALGTSTPLKTIARTEAHRYRWE